MLIAVRNWSERTSTGKLHHWFLDSASCSSVVMETLKTKSRSLKVINIQSVYEYQNIFFSRSKENNCSLKVYIYSIGFPEAGIILNLTWSLLVSILSSRGLGLGILYFARHQKLKATEIEINWHVVSIFKTIHNCVISVGWMSNVERELGNLVLDMHLALTIPAENLSELIL